MNSLQSMILMLLLLFGLSTDCAQFAEFVARCPFSHRLSDDPIVYPMQPGASHLHDFYGSKITNAFSDETSDYMNGATTCSPLVDRSPYWIPALLNPNNQPVTAKRATFYYQNRNIGNLTSIQRIPLGLRMIAGDAHTSIPPTGPRRTHWGCQGENVADSNMVKCASNNPNLEAYVRFPECWDGAHLDSMNHKSHMAYAIASTQKCPMTHPVPLPSLEFKILFPVIGGSGYKISSGSGLTLHGDFWNAWDECEQELRLINCIRRGKKCAENGFPSDGTSPIVMTAEQACEMSGITTTIVDESDDINVPDEPHIHSSEKIGMIHHVDAALRLSIDLHNLLDAALRE